MAKWEITLAHCTWYNHIVYKKLLKLVDECQRYSKPKQCHFRDTVYSMTEKTISGDHAHVSPGSTETARRDGIANHHLIAHSLSNISTKNYQIRLMCVEVIVCNISVVFWDTVHISSVILTVKDDAAAADGESKLWLVTGRCCLVTG